MPLKTLVVITLRLYTIYWLVEGVTGFLSIIPIFMEMEPHLGNVPVYMYLLPPLGMLFVAGVLWVSAFRISSQITKGLDTPLTFTSLTKEDLYCFAFVFLGIFFALSSIFSTLQVGYQFFTLDFPQPDGNPTRGRYFWPFLGHALTLIAGFACVFGARVWTRKLIHLEQKHEVPTHVPPTT